jgi:hypothetical protein
MKDNLSGLMKKKAGGYIFMGKVKFFFVFLLVLNLKLFSQVAIEVVDDSEDMVGQRLVFKVKEKFASSSIFRLTYKDEPRVQVIILTMDRFKGDRFQENISTMYAVIWVFKFEVGLPIYLNSTMGFAGSQVLDESAESIVAKTEKLISTIIKLLQPKEN